MVAVIGLSILFNIPRYLDDHVVRREDGSVVFERTYLGNNATFQLIYAGLFYYIVIYALPVAILTVMTYRQTLVLYRSRLFKHMVQDYEELSVSDHVSWIMRSGLLDPDPVESFSVEIMFTDFTGTVMTYYQILLVMAWSLLFQDHDLLTYSNNGFKIIRL